MKEGQGEKNRENVSEMVSGFPEITVNGFDAWFISKWNSFERQK